MKKTVKVLLWVVSVLLVLFFVVGFSAGNFFYELALNPHSDKTEVLQAEHNEVDMGEKAEEQYDEDRAWFDELYKPVRLQSYDGLSLVAYELKREDSADWAVICHGYISAGWMMVSWAKQMYERGYNVLLPDARGCGNSEGDYVGMGWHDRLDVLGWLERLNGQYAPENIVLFGVSMGGATVMMASGEQLPGNVRAVIEDCGYTSAMDEFSYQLDALFGLPRFPLMQFSSSVARLRAGYWLSEASAAKQVAKSTTPTLFIHGENDTFVPVQMVDAVYEAASCEKEKLVVAGAGHGAASTTDPELYWDTVDAFLAKYVPGGA